MKHISVVVCAKNEEKYLPPCIKALRKQLLKPEIVVVYSKSKDKTISIAKKLADVAVDDKCKGFAYARNIGWRVAKGDIIAYCDADAVPPEDWTARIAWAFRDNPELIAVSGPLILPKGRFKLRLALKLWAELFPAFWGFLGKNYLWGANMAFKRSILQKYPFKVDFLEDYDTGKRLRHCGFGRVWFNTKLKMPVSSRRFDKSFHALAIKYYVRAWLQINFKRDVKSSYWKNN